MVVRPLPSSFPYFLVQPQKLGLVSGCRGVRQQWKELWRLSGAQSSAFSSFIGPNVSPGRLERCFLYFWVCHVYSVWGEIRPEVAWPLQHVEGFAAVEPGSAQAVGAASLKSQEQQTSAGRAEDNIKRKPACHRPACPGLFLGEPEPKGYLVCSRLKSPRGRWGPIIWQSGAKDKLDSLGMRFENRRPGMFGLQSEN